VNVALRIAGRELRGGLGGFRIFLACLALGVAAIAAVGSVREAIQEGLSREGAAILGGDAEMSFTYRFASDDERAHMDRIAEDRVRDGRFPLHGHRRSRGGPGPRADAGARRRRGLSALWRGRARPRDAAGRGAGDGRPARHRHAAASGRPAGAGRGRHGPPRHAGFRVARGAGGGARRGGGRLRARPAQHRAAGRAGGSGLLAPGTLFDTQYRLALPDNATSPTLEEEAETLFADTGMRWRDARNGAPGVQEFVDRIGAFLVLVGLAGLAVGGIGVSSAVRAYLDGKIATIATLKTLGAEARTIFTVYFAQIGLLTLVGIGIGVVLGALLPLALAPIIEARLPVPIAVSVYPAPLAEAALYGLLTALIFTLWPLARTEQVRAAALYRDASGPSRAAFRANGYLIVIALLAAGACRTGRDPLRHPAARARHGGRYPRLAPAAGAVGAWHPRLSRRLARSRWVRGRTALRTALGAVGGPGSEATSVVLSLGLGLAVLASVGQIDANLRAAIQRDLPEVAPSYFFVDIQPDQLEPFLDRVENDPAVSRVDTAPMLRGIITRINGERASDVAGDHWVIQGDRGVTYTTTAPPEDEIVDGAWWPDDYDGPPLVAFAAEEAMRDRP
jgi:putative ABC transport system permease protein